MFIFESKVFALGKKTGVASSCSVSLFGRLPGFLSDVNKLE